MSHDRHHLGYKLNPQTGELVMKPSILDILRAHPSSKQAIRHVVSGNSYSYGQLTKDIVLWRRALLRNNVRRFALMGENSYQFAAPFFAALTLPGTFVVPLCTKHTAAEIQYQVEDSGCTHVLSPQRFSQMTQFLERSHRVHQTETFVTNTDETPSERADAQVASRDSKDTGYILYTSGTSGKPKGVVTPVKTYMAQVEALAKAWHISPETRMLQTLPLHHVHGLVIGMSLPILKGGEAEFLFPFSAEQAINRLADRSLPKINTYTAVPTIYSNLVQYIGQLSGNKLEVAKEGLRNLKLAMCGSAALPMPLRKAWDNAVDNQVPLLERYGMTETGITLSQSFDPEQRVAGTVGGPVPSVELRFVGDDGNVSKTGPGEIQLKGPVVFETYLNRPDATKETFTEDGWFKTGDIGTIDDKANVSIMGRASMDIIKSGGEKISALEIEREMLGLDEISECAVVGIPSEKWGEEVAAVVVLDSLAGKEYDIEQLRNALRKTLTSYKLPRHMVVVDQLPRNQMGKVVKKPLKELFK